MTVQDLPAVNASLNGLSTVFILAGLYFIKRDMKLPHIVSMITALVTSTAFLTCYLIYHYAKAGHVTKFTHPGWPRAVYFFILGTHVPLAGLVVPLILLTIIPAFRAIYDKHRTVARWTYPIWLYVWFPPVEVAG